MPITIALAGNPNCGKTTMFNAMTGASQYVGNWPGVTVEKKEGKLKGYSDVTVTDLPGIYSLSPYTLEEVVSRNYLMNGHPDAIINLVDATNLERNLYLTTQILEMGIPVVVALNMMDLVRKNGDRIDAVKLSKKLGCPVIEVSALKGTGLSELYAKAVEAAKVKVCTGSQHRFSTPVETALEEIESLLQGKADTDQLRWYAVKLFERDEKAAAALGGKVNSKRLEEIIIDCEKQLDDDSESIITNERYEYITSILKDVYRKNRKGMSVSDRIDQVVTNRIAALPIFAAVMFLVYAIAMGDFAVSIGTRLTDWANDGLFGDGWLVPFVSDVEGFEDASSEFEEAEAIVAAFEAGESTAYLYDADEGVTTALEVNEESYAAALAVEEPDPTSFGVWVPGIPAILDGLLLNEEGDPVISEWLYGLIQDGIVAGVGAVLGFVPQMLILFLLLALLEDCGYMARIAFIMDRIFRRFGLSGKSFIPMLVATGCGVPGIMASRTIEQDRDRKMTIMTTCFMPCGAKAPIIALFAGALFGHSALVAASAYFIGIASVIISGIMLKKLKAFAGEPAPFVMELPAYHTPTAGNVLRATWERGWSFIKRAGTLILLSSIILWFLSGFGFTAGGLEMVDANESILAAIGGAVCWIFAPLGFGTWEATVAAITGLIAKEEVVGTMSVLYQGNLTAAMGTAFTGLTAYSFMIFNLLCAPCFAAMGAIKREMNNTRWTLAAIGYMCLWAYVLALIVYQLGGVILGEVSFGTGTVAGILALAGVVYMLVRKGYQPEEGQRLGIRSVSAA